MSWQKPLALTHAEAKAMFDAARQHGVMLLEAYPYWFQPQTGDMLRLLHGGAIGEVKSIQASFGFTMANPQGNIRNNPALGGGVEFQETEILRVRFKRVDLRT